MGSMPMAIRSLAQIPGVLTPATPLVRSTAFSISFAAFIISFDLDNVEKTVHVAYISKPFPEEVPGSLDAWRMV